MNPTGEAAPGQFPWHAWLIDWRGRAFCGASILSERYILTAAFCFEEAKMDKVVVGALDMADPRDLSYFPLNKYAQSFDIIEPHCVKLISHGIFPGIAVIKLKKPIQLNDHVGPICLARNISNLDHKYCYSTGLRKLDERFRDDGDLATMPNPFKLHFAYMPPYSGVGGEDFAKLCSGPDPHLLCISMFSAQLQGDDIGGPSVCWDRSSKRWHQFGVASQPVEHYCQSACSKWKSYNPSENDVPILSSVKCGR